MSHSEINRRIVLDSRPKGTKRISVASILSNVVVALGLEFCPQAIKLARMAK